MDYVTYTELTTIYGQDKALEILQQIEQLAQLKQEMLATDMDARFKIALGALSEIDFAY